MTDPSDGMKSFQKELRRGGIAIQVAKTDPGLFVHLDAPNGPREIRITYVRLKGKNCDGDGDVVAQRPEDGKPYFAVGYAVPKRFQKQGRAKDVLVAALADMQAGLARNGISEFYIEAIIGADNVASRKIAEQVISDEPEAITEGQVGVASIQILAQNHIVTCERWRAGGPPFVRPHLENEGGPFLRSLQGWGRTAWLPSLRKPKPQRWANHRRPAYYFDGTEL